MSEIFDRANAITGPNLVSQFGSSVSQGGIRRTQTFGPSFYEVACAVPQMYFDDFIAIENEIQGAGLDNGVGSLSTTIPHHTPNRGTPRDNVRVRLAGQAGNTINIDGYNIGDTLMAGDWIQFTGHTKVYQVVGNFTADVNGQMNGVRLNTTLIESPADNELLRFAQDVQFNLVLERPVSHRTVPGSLFPLYRYGSFRFREVTNA